MGMRVGDVSLIVLPECCEWADADRLCDFLICNKTTGVGSLNGFAVSPSLAAATDGAARILALAAGHAQVRAPRCQRPKGHDGACGPAVCPWDGDP